MPLLVMRFMNEPQWSVEKIFMNEPGKRFHSANGKEYNSDVDQYKHYGQLAFS
jgi:hypothetical protein